MTVGGIWRSNALIMVLLVIINFMFISMPPVLWMALGILILCGAIYLSFRQGGAMGHEACGVSKMIERATNAQSPTHGQMDARTYKQAYSVSTGIKGLFASALIPYVINAAYLAVMLIYINKPEVFGAESAVSADAIPAVVFVTRFLSWLVTLPFWPLLSHWHPSYNVVTADVIALMMLSPFVLPTASFLGYLQGPKLWEKTEKAMAQGKRRAKAKSRVIKKRQPRVQKPEI